MSAPIPTDVADVTSTWLEGVLQAYAPGARLRSIDVVEAHSGTTGRARVLLAHDDPNLPGSVFVKLAPFDAEQRMFVDQQGMGIAEARFYAELATDVPVRHPQPFYAAHDDAGRYVMVLEDLHAVGARYPGHSDADLASFVEHTIDAFAAMHAAFWDSPRFSPDGDLAWVRGASSSQSYGSAAALVRFAVEELGERLPAASHELAEVYVPRAEKVPGLIAEGTRTLVHGDAHLGNMFIDGTEPGFLDWAMVGCAPGLRDVAYFLGNSVPTQLRRAQERHLIARYCRGLQERGAEVDLDEAWGQYQLHLVSAWIAAVVTAGMGSKWQPIEIGLAATMRANAAIEDHGVAKLLTTRLR
ncbi:phosphotransferase family protein [Mycobacterium sp. 3519A]|uniref:phosphotransferase family protein n=1 Tax=Mycobacterium sp. 3519A TaxID=2057184 RepID=UPI000C7AB722|nr:aminoglycoside phosphotransferase family protein [Mycobacterium sp. 3519A]